jgi:hypothetical protein
VAVSAVAPFMDCPVFVALFIVIIEPVMPALVLPFV